MAKHRAIIVGCGRIGVGRNWIETPYVYTHAGAYKALGNRVDLLGLIDLDVEYCLSAASKWKTQGWTDIGSALLAIEPDIVSICTPPDQRHAIFEILEANNSVRGVWCEKPLGLTTWWKPVQFCQVNYIRRWDERHKRIAAVSPEPESRLWVFAKKDVHTVCHFTDLANFWGIPRANLIYVETQEPNSYVYQSRFRTEFFPLGGMTGGFMEAALGNLLDAVEGKADLISPPESAIQSEAWANELLAGTDIR